MIQSYLVQKNNSDVLVITSCTKSKLSRPAPAYMLYRGDIFRKTQKWVDNNGFDELIISAKYGLVEPNQVLSPYNKTLKKPSDIDSLKEKVVPKLKKVLKKGKYRRVVLILGNNYLEVIKSLIFQFPDIAFYRLESKNGIFDYKKNIIKLIENDFDVLYHFSGPEIPFRT
ncbi:MAG: DUF6884 domain-containing protein [Promethearchaeota archaeon]